MVQASIARYDQNGITIKNWCTTTWGAATAYGFENNSLLIVAVAPYLVLCFFITEWVYRVYQHRFISHAHKLQEYLLTNQLNSYQYNFASAAVNPLKNEKLSVLKKAQFVTLYYMLLFGSFIAISVKLYYEN